MRLPFPTFRKMTIPTFRTRWNVATNGGTITLPLVSGGTYNFHVEWGDSSSSDIAAWNAAAKTHTYTTAGNYEVKITGTITGWRFNQHTDAPKLTRISEWGPLKLVNANSYFYGCTNLQITAPDVLDLTGITSLNSMFRKCSLLTTVPSMDRWDVSNVTNMSYMFTDAVKFNQYIGSWDVGKVENFGVMFGNAAVFNQNISAWNTSSATSMFYMFGQAYKFNQPIGGWETGNVTTMAHMFRGEPGVAGNEFNQDISDWDVSKVTTMQEMFYLNYYFNQDIGGWDVSGVTNMNQMFSNAYAFNQDITEWNVGNVTGSGFTYMFGQARAFNQDISGWDISKATSLTGMFLYATSFNQPIGSWYVESVMHFEEMFSGATAFNQYLGAWILETIENMEGMFDGVTLSTANYDATLIGWDTNKSEWFEFREGAKFSGGNSTYCTAGDERAALIAAGLDITDGGLDCG